MGGNGEMITSTIFQIWECILYLQDFICVSVCEKEGKKKDREVHSEG